MLTDYYVQFTAHISPKSNTQRNAVDPVYDGGGDGDPMPMGHSRWTCFLHTETLTRCEHADADVDIKESLLLSDSEEG